MKPARKSKSPSHPCAPLTLEFERAAWEAGFDLVAGVDEVGRGCIAGPVIAAAVILPRPFNDPGVGDSKTIPERRRESLYESLITMPGLVWAVGECSVEEIWRLNILEASKEAMRRAVTALASPARYLLIDGLPVGGFNIPETAIVGGDARSPSIAAASIIAKVTRDRLMRRLDDEDPRFGFSRHKGYATARHLAMIARHGITRHHRRGFAPVAQLALDLQAAGLPRKRREG